LLVVGKFEVEVSEKAFVSVKKTLTSMLFTVHAHTPPRSQNLL
jgi:hypothetical protein